MHEIYALVAGTLYGLLIGIIPSAGATTGLVIALGVGVQLGTRQALQRLQIGGGHRGRFRRRRRLRCRRHRRACRPARRRRRRP